MSEHFTPADSAPQDGLVCALPLSGKAGEGRFFFVDADDLPVVARFRWHLSKGYVARTVGHRLVYLHRFLMGAARGQLVDHRDRNPLNNVRSNLRFATKGQNNSNCFPRGKQSRFKGVSPTRNKGGLPWQGRIRDQGRTRYLGVFLTEEEAARAYDRAARELFGEFACTNFGD